MSNSFIGVRVSVALHSGGHLEGVIEHVDGETGTLTIKGQIDGHRTSIARADIADLSILPKETNFASTSTPPATTKGIAQSPRVKKSSSSSSSAVAAAAKPNSAAAGKATQSIATPPVAPSAMLNGSTGNSKKPTGKNATQKRKDKTDALRTATSIASSEQADMKEDFDFDKAAANFDKQKIWEEIRTADKTDPTSLLVSHNRRHNGASSVEQQLVAKNTRRAQDPLAWNEPVLSPTNTSHPPTEPNRGNDGTLDLRALEADLDKTRHSTSLQRDFELSRLRDEVQRLQAQNALVEALLGVDLSNTAEEEDKWNVTVYESLAAHAEARRLSDAAIKKGALTFAIRSTNGKLRYLGPNRSASDAAVIERLPAQYHNEMGLKMETASLFMRRIKDAIQVAAVSVS